ncbi:MAG: hypothetical protein KDC46_00930 [Thermoleophilia bacterium]|nr:hypothetical protein [Thermoleophilia bacterium]
MTDDSPTPDAEAGTTVEGGGPGVTEDPAMAAVRAAAAKLEMLSDETREMVLSKMDPARAERIRDYLASMPDRPHGQFSMDVAERRKLLHETANSLSARRTADADAEVRELAREAAHRSPSNANQGSPMGVSPTLGGAPPMGVAPNAPAVDPLDRLRELHPAAIARAMQGERAEAWAIVLGRLDDNARAALQLYLDASARAAIEDARVRQEELAKNSPALLATVVAAIARTVVPRAMREHHALLSTTPLAWTGQSA